MPSFLCVVLALLRIVPSLWAPLNFDESYNLQVVLNLVHGHGYATDGALMGGRLALFDYHITTGPALLLPVAAVVAVLGSHVWVFRLVPALFSAALCAAWWRIGVRLGGSWAGVAAVACVVALDTRICWPGMDTFDPGSVIGENAAVFFLLAAVLCLHRPGYAGALASLAILSKTILVLGLPGLAFGVLLSARRRETGVVRAEVWCAGGVIGVIAAWQLVRVLWVGWSTNVAMDRAYLHYLVTDPYDPGPGRRPGLIPHVAVQLALTGIWGGALALVLPTVTVAVAWRRGWRVPDIMRPAVAALLVAGSLLELWWLLLEHEGWPRHSMPATELWAPLALAGAVAGMRFLAERAEPGGGAEWRKAVGFGLPVALGTQLAWMVATPVTMPGPSLSDQKQVAAQVQELGPSYRFTDGHMSPELSLLRPLSARPLTERGGLLVLSGIAGPVPTTGCDHILYEHAGYVVCRVSPAP